MRKKLLTMMLCLVSLAMQAQSQLVVKTTSGSEEKFAIEKKPVVTLGVYGEKVKVSYDGKEKELDLKSLQVEGVKAGTDEYAIIDMDGNTFMLPLSKIKSFSQAAFEEEADYLPRVIAKDPSVSIYYAALEATHMNDTLKHYVDMSYTWASDADRVDSCTWSNDALCIPVASEYDNVAYPEKRFFNFTAFLVPDAVLNEKYGITNLDGLRKKAHELYDPMYPEDVDVTDETDRRNALNRFISYHLLPIYGEYYNLTAMDGGNLQYNFMRRMADITDWYETLMPYSIMKFSFPSGTQQGLYVNRRGVQSRADSYGAFVQGAKVTLPEEMEVNNTALNGKYHYIDDIVAYDETMQKVICNDRIRCDATTLSPDFMTLTTDGQIARGHRSGRGEAYATPSSASRAIANSFHCVGFKPGFARNFEYGDETHLHVRPRSLYFWSYEGDEVNIKDNFDVKVKLPPVPVGDYEVRLQTCVGFKSRGIIQVYIDDEPVGEPIDFRPDPRTLLGEWKSDSELGSEEAIAAFDKEMRAKGWMKGVGDYCPGVYSEENTPDTKSTMRNLSNLLRKILGTFHSDGKSDHYLRLKQMLDESNHELAFDLIELVPVGMIENENIY